MRHALRAATLTTLALLLAAGIAAASEPKTALGKWMKPNMGTPMAGQDFAALQTSFGVVAKNPPPAASYPQWVSLAEQGAAAAAKQDVKGVKASCKGCHDAYKDKYRADPGAASHFP